MSGNLTAPSPSVGAGQEDDDALPLPPGATPVSRDDALPLPSGASLVRPPSPARAFGEGAVDVGRSGLTGIARGFVGIAGLPGSMSQLYDVAKPYAQWAANKIFTSDTPDESNEVFNEAMKRVRASQTPQEQAGTHGRVLGMHFPTSDHVIKSVEPYAPGIGYTPETGVGRVAQTVGEFVGGAPVGEIALPVRAARLAREAGVLGNAARIGREAASLPNVGAGVASGALGELYHGQSEEPWARLGGAFVAPLALAGMKAAGSSPERLIGRAAMAPATKTKGLTLEEIQALQAQGHDVSLMDVRNVRPLTESALGREPQSAAAYQLAASMKERANNAVDRFREAVNRAMGRDVDVIEAQRIAKADADLARHYPAVYGLPHAQQIWNADLQAVVQNPTALKAARKAAETVAMETGVPMQFPFVRSNTGTWVLRPGTSEPPLQFWDYTKRFLQDDVNALQMAGRTTEASAVGTMTNRLRDNLSSTAVVPEYGALLARGQKYFGQMDAFGAGGEFLAKISPLSKIDPADVGKRIVEFNRYTPAEQEAFRTALAHNFKENPQIAARMFDKNSSAFEGSLRLVLGPDQMQGIKNSVQAHRAAEILTNLSAVAPREVSALNTGLAGTAVGAVMHLLQGVSPGYIGLGLAAGSYTHLLHMARNRQAVKMMEMLGSNDPAIIAKVVEAAKRDPKTGVLLQDVSKTLAGAYSDYARRQQERDQRPTRASGGRIGGAYRRKALALIQAAERAKKAHARTTQSILDMPDETVAKALTLADKSI